MTIAPAANAHASRSTYRRLVHVAQQLSLVLAVSMSVASCDRPHASITDVIVRDPEGLLLLEGLERIPGLLSIECKECTSLETLRSLQHVETLIIEGCENLSDLSGLEDLTIAYGLGIRDNPRLEDISQVTGSQPLSVNVVGNESLRTVEGFDAITTAESVMISLNENLEVVDGFRHLTSIDGNLMLLANPNLQRFDGFAALRHVADITIGDSPGLESLESLSGIERIDEDLSLGGLGLPVCADVTLRDQIGLENIGGTRFPRDCRCGDGEWEMVPGNCQ